jgi:SLT domain-containing protein
MKLKIVPRGLVLMLGIWLSNGLTLAQNVQLESSVLQRAQLYEPALLEAATKHEVNAKLLWVIAYLETRFNPRSISPKGARGMMQFMPGTAARWGLQNPHDPASAIIAAAQYLRYLQGRFGERPELLLAAYNAGEATVEAYLTGRSLRVGNKIINPRNRRTGGIPPYQETQKYVAQGMRILGGKFQAEQSLTRPSASPIKTNFTARKIKSTRATRSQVVINLRTKITTKIAPKSISFTSESGNELPTLRKQRSITFQ